MSKRVRGTSDLCILDDAAYFHSCEDLECISNSLNKIFVFIENKPVYWPECSAKGCEARVCKALRSDKCFVHTPGLGFIKSLKISWRNLKLRLGIKLAKDDIKPSVNNTIPLETTIKEES